MAAARRLPQIAPAAFYNADGDERWRARLRLLQAAGDARAAPARRFALQADAFAFLAEHRRTRSHYKHEHDHEHDARHELELRVFSQEVPDERGGASGRRCFLVASVGDMWRRTALAAPAARCFYELIRDREPCHIYLDVEYDRREPANAAVPFDHVMARLRCLLLASLREHFAGLDAALRSLPATHRRHAHDTNSNHDDDDDDECDDILANETQAIELDSTTAAKASRHLVLRLPRGAAFASNVQLGNFLANTIDLLEAAELGAASDLLAPHLCSFRFVSDEQRQRDDPLLGSDTQPAISSSTSSGSSQPELPTQEQRPCQGEAHVEYGDGGHHDDDDLTLWLEQCAREADAEEASLGANAAAQPAAGAMPRDRAFTLDEFLVWKRNNLGAMTRTPIIDLAVYTRNRNFRLYGSSKLGKSNPLRLVAAHNLANPLPPPPPSSSSSSSCSQGSHEHSDSSRQHEEESKLELHRRIKKERHEHGHDSALEPEPEPEPELNQRVFELSLVTNMDPVVGPRLLLYCERHPGLPGHFTRCHSAPLSTFNRLSAVPLPSRYAADYGEEQPFESHGGVSGRHDDSKHACVDYGTRASPFPKIDRFIESQRYLGGAPARIRSKMYFPDSNTLLYHISDNRYCHNIARQHKRYTRSRAFSRSPSHGTHGLRRL